MKGDDLSEAFICEKTLDIYCCIVKKTLGTNSKDFDFKESRRWLKKSIKEVKFSVLRHGEVASSNKKEAEKYKKEFSDIIKAGLVPQQVISGEETGLFWKKLSNRAFITEEENVLPGQKPIKDRLTLLMCGNISGYFKA